MRAIGALEERRLGKGPPRGEGAWSEAIGLWCVVKQLGLQDDLLVQALQNLEDNPTAPPAGRRITGWGNAKDGWDGSRSFLPAPVLR